MLLTVGKGIREEISHSAYPYAKANNKYMKKDDNNKELSYLQYWDVNNLYGWAMSQKLPVNNFIKDYNEEIDEEYFREVDLQYPQNLHVLHNDLPLLPERTKIEKVEKLVANLHDKTEYVIHIRNLKKT